MLGIEIQPNAPHEGAALAKLLDRHASSVRFVSHRGHDKHLVARLSEGVSHPNLMETRRLARVLRRSVRLMGHDDRHRRTRRHVLEPIAQVFDLLPDLLPAPTLAANEREAVDEYEVRRVRADGAGELTEGEGAPTLRRQGDPVVPAGDLGEESPLGRRGLVASIELRHAHGDAALATEHRVEAGLRLIPRHLRRQQQHPPPREPGEDAMPDEEPGLPHIETGDDADELSWEPAKLSRRVEVAIAGRDAM